MQWLYFKLAIYTHGDHVRQEKGNATLNLIWFDNTRLLYQTIVFYESNRPPSNWEVWPMRYRTHERVHQNRWHLQLPSFTYDIIKIAFF